MTYIPILSHTYECESCHTRMNVRHKWETLLSFRTSIWMSVRHACQHLTNLVTHLCMCLCIYVYMYIYAYICICVWQDSMILVKHTCIYICVYMYMCILMDLSVTRNDGSRHTHIYIYIYVYIYVRLYICVNMYMCVTRFNESCHTYTSVWTWFDESCKQTHKFVTYETYRKRSVCVNDVPAHARTHTHTHTRTLTYLVTLIRMS